MIHLAGQHNRSEKKRLLIQILSQQVYHDVATSYVALQALADKFEDAGRMREEDVNDIKDVVWSIKAITHNLSSDHYTKEWKRGRGRPVQPEMVYPIVNKIVLRYRMQYQRDRLEITFPINTSHSTIFCLISQSEIERIMTNLIQNSIESVSADRKAIVSVSLEKIGLNAVIKIIDNGGGMSDNAIAMIKSGKRFTQGKPDGRGIGLSYLVETIRKYRGDIEISSRLSDEEGNQGGGGRPSP